MPQPPDQGAPTQPGDPDRTRYETDPDRTRWDRPARTDSDLASTLAAPPPAPPALATPAGDSTDATLTARSASGRLYPRRFGKYNLLAPLATGGMGVVFRAVELEPAVPPGAHAPGAPGRLKEGRVVALKQILPQRVEAPGAVERFQRETQAAKRLDHPNIVPVYESGEIDGEHYFTMPYVPGGNLQQCVGGKDRLSVRQAVRLVRQLADAVQYAHEQDVIHRDIKPQNILLQPNTKSTPDDLEGGSYLAVTPRLTDFGLARLVTEESSLSLSQKGEAMGTPGYMPPEQARGSLDEVGPASDVYSLGAVLYALLAGQPPFPRHPGALVPVVEILRQVAEEEPRRLRELRPEVPDGLEDICEKCLQKSPRNRYASAGQLGEALDDVLENKLDIRHTPRRAGWLVRTLRRLGRSVRKHPVRSAYIAGSAGLIVVLLAMLVAVLYPYQAEAKRLRREAEETVAQAKSASEHGDSAGAVTAYRSAREKYDDLLEKSSFLRSLFLPPPPVLRQARNEAERGLLLAQAESDCRSGASLRRDERNLDAAKRVLDAALQELGRLELEPGHPLYAKKQQVLAEVYHELGNLYSDRQTVPALRDALRDYQQALKIREELCKEFPDNRACLRNLARSHGYLGDTQLALGDVAGAKDSYARAAQLRERIIALIPEGNPRELRDALCQHARDYGNRQNYDERMRLPEEARKEYLAQLRFYQEKVAPALGEDLLPDEFWTDRANCLVDLANLELDMGLGINDGLALKRLDQALAEYELLARRRSAEHSKELVAARGWAWVVRGKALVLAGDLAQGRVDLERGREDLRSLGQQMQADDLYRLAVAQAWLGQDALALDKLEDAIRAGFNHLPRLEREKGFDRLRREKSAAYAALVEKLRRSQMPGP